MNNRKSLIFIVPLIALILMSCRASSARIIEQTIEGSGTPAMEQRDLQGQNIERVSLSSIGTLTIIQGDEESLTVEADDNLLPYIETTVSGRELIIKVEEGINFKPKTAVRYTLQIKNLERLQVSGAASVTADSLDTERLELSVSGAGNINIDELTTTALKAQASGAGNFSLSGSADEQEIEISGAGNYSGGNLHTRQANVRISGMGDVTLWVDTDLNVRISGLGNVSYYGSPEVRQNISGGGSVTRLGAHE